MILKSMLLKPIYNLKAGDFRIEGHPLIVSPAKQEENEWER